MKHFFVLGGYGNVGQTVVRDLIASGHRVTVAGRSAQKIESFLHTFHSPNISGKVVDINNQSELIASFADADVVINCLEYTFNALVLDACLLGKKDYVDLGDSYEGIMASRAKDGTAIENGVRVCLGTGSAPGIVNILIKHIAESMDTVETLTISFADIVKNAPNEILPFNFQTVIEEITGDALLFENGKYGFVPGGSKVVPVEFGYGFDGEDHKVTRAFVTNHDEQFSLPLYLRDKGIKNVYFVMKHADNVIRLVESLKEFGFLDTKPLKIKGVEISPYDFANEVMKQFAPQNFKTEDKEILYVKLDTTVGAVINHSVDGVPAGIMNTGIGCSLIAQYLAENPGTPGVVYPEDFVDPVWFIEALKKRDFEVYINEKKL